MGKSAIGYGFTVVQHSGYGYAYKPALERGLETRIIATQRDLCTVENAKGRVFATYKEAEGYALAEMYPPEVTGLAPRAPGSFSLAKVDGLRVYIPKAF